MVRFTAALLEKLLGFFEFHVLPTHIEGAIALLDAVDLKSDVTLGVVGLFEIGSGHSIDEALVVIALHDDPVQVPLTLFKGSLGGIGPHDFGLSQDAPPSAPAGFVVKITSGSVDGDLALRSIKATGRQGFAAFGTFGGGITFLGQVTAYLHTGVQCIIHLYFEFELKVLEGTFDEEAVGRTIGRGANEHAVLDFVASCSADDFGIAEPVLEPMLPTVFGLKVG